MNFSLKRFYYLLRNEVANQLGVIGLSFAVKAGILLLFYVITAKLSSKIFHDIAFWLVLYIGGFIFSARSFNLLKDPQDGYAYLMLPASTFEKWIVKWLLSSLGYIFFLTLAYTVFSIGAHYLCLALFEKAHPIFNVTQENRLPQFGVYMTLQLFFLVAGLFIQRLVFIKTLILFFALLISMTIIVYMISPHYIGLLAGKLVSILFPVEFLQVIEDDPDIELLWQANQWFFFFFTLPFFWMVGLFRLREKEVKS